MNTQTLILVLAPLIIIQISLQIYALLDIRKRKGARGNTVLWVIVVVFFQIIGVLAYFVAGRREDVE